ncbi:Hypothetical predicted protein [Paramuricea clavata]|uniref:Uncharacterized protein n=1 Tax=Paramuricea clavata TaxID=317549 RepID=A0A7D9M5L6_PARCT|nr:Hypothetical predicted protein [Paramuricea clavata]
MKVLHIEGKHNLLYHLSHCFLSEEENGSTCMPLNRMPYGLIDYNIGFFSSASSQKLGLEEHYAMWLETMLAHFGQKWLCLFSGPCWQYELNDDSQQTPHIEIPSVSNGVPSSSNEEILDCWNDKITASSGNAIQPSSNNEIPRSSNAEIQFNLIAESSSVLSDEILPTSIGQNPPSSDNEIPASSNDEILHSLNAEIPQTSIGQNPPSTHNEILASSSNEIPASSNDEILHSLNAEIPQTSIGQNQPITDDEIQYNVNGKSASIIANALKDCSLDLINYSNDYQKCLSEIDDIDFQLENFCCLVDNGDNGNSEGAHALENDNPIQQDHSIQKSSKAI